MATFEITSPDGGVYEITAPEGASEQDILSYAQSQFSRPGQRPAPQFGRAGSALAGAAQGYTAGFGDEIMGGISAAGAYGIGKGMEALGMNNPAKGRTLAELYRMTRDRIRQENRAAREQNPGSYLTGEIGGGVASPANKLMPGGSGFGQMAKSGAAYGAASGLGNSEAEDLPGMAADTLTSAATGAVLAPVMGKAMQAVPSGVRKLFGVNPQAVDEAAQIGVDLPAAAASDLRTPKLFDRFLSKFPGSATTMEDTARKTIGQIDDAINSRMGGSKAVTQQEAGSMIQKGAERYVNRFQKVAGKLYDRLDDQIPQEQLINPAALKAAVNSEVKPFLNNPEFRSLLPATVNTLDDLLAPSKGTLDLVNGGYHQIEKEIPYELLKRLRTNIGDKLSKSYLLADEQQGALKSLYGALTEDMRATAQAQGPAAIKAFERANSFYAKGAEQIEGALQKVTANKYPEQVYDAALSGTKQGGSKIQGIMKALTADEREVLRGTVVKRMGLATPGQQNAAGDLFSPSTFLANWNKASPEAKAAIFSNGTYRQSLDKLARVAERLNEVNRYANTSNTGPFVTIGGLFMAALGGFTGGAGVALKMGAAITGAYGAAKLMTSPKFVNWLADNAASNATPGALAKALERLPRVAASEPEIQDELKALIMQFSPDATQPTNQGE